MDRNFIHKKTVGGITILAATLLLVGLIAFGVGTRAAGSGASQEPGKTEQPGILPISTSEEDNRGLRINGHWMRWNNNAWEYSEDGGQTWSDVPTDGVKAGDDGSITLQQGEGAAEDFDTEAFLREMEEEIDSILSDLDEQYGRYMPEGSEGGSFFSFGDSLARQADGVWEFSSDGGQTWTKDPPEGFESGEDGTRFRFGGDADGGFPDLDGWLEGWFKERGGTGESDGDPLDTNQNVAV